MAQITKQHKDRIARAYAAWAESICPRAQEQLGEIEGSATVSVDLVARWVPLVIGEIAVSVAALTIEAASAKPDWVEASLWDSSACEVMLQLIAEKPDALTASVIEANVDVEQYFKQLASKPSVKATLEQFHATTQEDIRKLVMPMAKQAAAKQIEVIRSVVPGTIKLVRETWSISILKEKLEDALQVNPSPAVESHGTNDKLWWQFWK